MSYIYTYSLIHTSEGSVVIAKWISALSFGLSFDVDDAFSSYSSKKRKKKNKIHIFSLFFFSSSLSTSDAFSLLKHRHIYTPKWWEKEKEGEN
jgi:hypothetical protein